jgi:2-oxoglutarate ferredoxin oxidoreductase subunit delta
MLKTSRKGDKTKRLVIIAERCKECGFCIEFCPQQIIAKSNDINSKGYHPVYINDEECCTGCDICGMICPDFAIGVVDTAKSDKDKPGTGL